MIKDFENVPDTASAYAAGLVDGEGCITIQRISRPKRGYCIYQLRVIIANTEHVMLDWLQLCFGGSVQQKAEKRVNRKDCWVWSIVSRQAGLFLEKILPYMVTKKVRAEIAIEYRHSLPDGRSVTLLEERERIALRYRKRINVKSIVK